MKTQHLMAGLITLFMLTGLIFGQQWDGASNTTGPIYRTGNVGIGTSSPYAKLFVWQPSAFDTDYNSQIDNVCVSRVAATGLNAVGGSIGFTRVYGTPSPRRAAAIAAVITHPDYDACTGLAFYVHPSGSSSQPIVEHMRLTHGGNLGIGTTTVPSGYKLAVDGKIIAEEVQVEMSGSWPDHVFAEGYRLTPLAEVEAYIKANRHLPNMPSAAEVAENGVSLGDMQATLLQKVEELTLYVIAIDGENRALRERIDALEEGRQP